MEMFLVLIGMLAVWRATNIVQREDGPWGLFARLQAWVASKTYKAGSLNAGFFCFWCLSMWIALPFAIALSDSVTEFFMIWLALSAGAIILDKYIEK